MRKSPRYNSIEEAEELLRRGYFIDKETFRISEQIRRDFDNIYINEPEIKLINNETSSKKKWWKIWK